MWKLLDESHVAPGGCRKRNGIVVAVPGPIETISGDLVPLLTRHLASFAAYAESGVGEKSHRPFWRRRGRAPKRIDDRVDNLSREGRFFHRVTVSHGVDDPPVGQQHRFAE